MGNPQDIRRRIGSVKGTQQLTHAMELVAASRLMHAQERIEAQRPYALKLREMIAALASTGERHLHPLLRKRPLKNIDVLVLTSDRGLCGGFNTNICRTAERYFRDNVRPWREGDRTAGDGKRAEGHGYRHDVADLLLIGKKGRDYFRRRDYPVRKEYPDVLITPRFERVQAIGDELIAQYTARELDGVLMIYNEFKSATQQDVIVEQLLPIEAAPEDTPAGLAYSYEPNRETLLDNMLTLHVHIQLWRVVLESLASEMGARMTAMSSATSNAGELIKSLTLSYNRARQETITNELMEVIGGAEALRE